MSYFAEKYWEALSDPEVFDALERKGLDADETLIELMENGDEERLIDLIENGEHAALFEDNEEDEGYFTDD
jgi:hypothetical protein